MMPSFQQPQRRRPTMLSAPETAYHGQRRGSGGSAGSGGSGGSGGSRGGGIKAWRVAGAAYHGNQPRPPPPTPSPTGATANLTRRRPSDRPEHPESVEPPYHKRDGRRAPEYSWHQPNPQVFVFGPRGPAFPVVPDSPVAPPPPSSTAKMSLPPTPAIRSRSVHRYGVSLHNSQRLPEGTLHVWIYQARHLVFRRLFETMYERHGLRLRVYVGSRATNDVGEIYETRRNYGGNMANPRWREDGDDARDNHHGHFSIPLIRETLRADTELLVEIVCGILVVAHTKVSLLSLFLGTFGTNPETLATQNLQFRPHWFPLAGEDMGLLEMALEFIPTKLVRMQENQLENHGFIVPGDEPKGYDHGVDQKQQHGAMDPAAGWPLRDYHAQERHAQQRRDRFELVESPNPSQSSEMFHRGRSTTASSARSTRFQLPNEEIVEIRRSSQSSVPPDVDIVDGYQSADDFSVADLHDGDASEIDPRDRASSAESDIDMLSLSARLDAASINAKDADAGGGEEAAAGASSQERLLNKQLWDLYRYGISDEAPIEIGAAGDSDDAAAPELSRKMSTISQASSYYSNYSIAFSDASEASMFSRDASTCASDILTYNDRIAAMEEAIRATRERRLADEAQAVAVAADSAGGNNAGGRRTPSPQSTRSPSISPPPTHSAVTLSAPPPPPAPTLTQAPPRPTMVSTYGWGDGRPPAIPLSSPPPSRFESIQQSPTGVVLFDFENIPVNRRGQTDPTLAAYREKMLARRRSLPISSLTTGTRVGFPPPPLLRENSMPRRGPPHSADGHRHHHLREYYGPPPPASAPLPPPPPPPPLPPRGPSLPLQLGNQATVADPKATGASASTLEPEDPEPDLDDTSSLSSSMSSNASSFRRKRSSSLHSVSDLLKENFQIHNIKTTPVRDDLSITSTSSSSSLTRAVPLAMMTPRPSSGECKLSRTSSHKTNSSRSSEATSTSAGDTAPPSSAVVPTMSTTGAPPRVRRNSKGNNVVQINGLALGVGKFINVGNVPGVIRYIGPTLFAPGQWIGIELAERKGKHNGTVQNVQYFECAPEHGIFIRAERLDISPQQG